MPDRVNASAKHSPVLCQACRYDLSGLATSGICPECSHSIQTSIDAEAAKLAEREPLPTWLRYLRSIYCAAFGTIVAAPFALPPIARVLGMPVNLGRRGAFFDVLTMCILPTLVVGVVMLCNVPERRPMLGVFTIVSMLVLLLWAATSAGG